MLPHDFTDTQGLDCMLLSCRHCNRTPSKAREDGCAIRELNETGSILLSDYNPDGKVWFAGRLCLTCDRPIMGHWLRRGSTEYWCHENQNVFSEGIRPTAVDPGEYWPDAGRYKSDGLINDMPQLRAADNTEGAD